MEPGGDVYLAPPQPGADHAVITASIDGTSPVPPFEQLRAQLADAIRAGLLEPGAQLPTVRQLAGDLDLAPNTVARAYKSLEETGFVQARGRKGTTVADGGALPADQRSSLLADAARRYLAETSRLGLSPADAARALRSTT